MNSKGSGESWYKKNIINILGVLIIVLTHLLCMFTMNSGCFGKGLYVGGDNYEALYGCVSEIKNKVTNGDSILYSWHSLGGMNFYSTFVSCVFNAPMLILTLIPIRYFNLACDFMLVFLAILMFFSMKYYLTHREFGLRFNKNSFMLLVFGIPYALAPVFCVGEGFLGFGIDSGEHEIELVYKPKGIVLGVIISLLTLLIGSMMCILKKGNHTTVTVQADILH